MSVEIFWKAKSAAFQTMKQFQNMFHLMFQLFGQAVFFDFAPQGGAADAKGPGGPDAVAVALG